MFLRTRRLRRLAAQLPKPGPDVRLDPALGFRVFAPGTFPEVQSILSVADRVIANEENVAVPKKGKAHLNHLLARNDMAKYPELVDFALTPAFLGAAADYLNDFPIVTQIFLWHAHAIEQSFSNSQLFHRDHDDFKQLKIFVYLSDVDMDSGPLTVLSASRTREASEKLGYLRSRKPNIPDEEMAVHVSMSEPLALTGPRGTVSFADTSQVFHYGSRVTKKDRYVMVIQYLTPTNYLMNPFLTFGPYPYAEFARPHHSPLQKLALGVGTVPCVGRKVKSLAYSN